VVLLLERVLVSWSLAMDERGKHQNLRGSGHRSVIPYVNGRTELYCSSLQLPEHFIAQGRAVTLRPRARQVAPRWLKSHTALRVIMVRSNK
jgi:hypothetical protein